MDDSRLRQRGVTEMDDFHHSKNETSVYQEERSQSGSPSGVIDVTHARFIGFLPILSFAATLLGSWESLSATFVAGLLNGGPVALVWGCLMSVIGALALSSSIAEMASIIPVAGAQYHWTARYAPGASNFFGLMQGWLTVFGWLALVAVPPYFSATLIEGLVILNYPDWVPKQWHGTLLMWASMVAPVVLNMYGRWIIPPLEIIGMVLHLLLLPIFIIVMVCLAPRSSPSFVFTTFVGDQSGYTNNGVMFSLGLLTAAYAMVGFDGPLHMSEEVRNSKINVPKAMVLGTLINGVMAFGWVITLLFTMGDIGAALSTPTGYPIIEIFYQATGSLAATNTMMAFLMIAGYVSLFGCFASVSRLVWAFARDNGLPFASFFVYVSPTLKIPTRALGLVVLVVVLLSFIELGSLAAFNALTSLSTLALYVSYVLPVLFFMIHKLRGREVLWGPFRMAKVLPAPFGEIFAIGVNLFAIAWGIYIIIFLPWPSTVPVTLKTLNWSGPVFGFVMLLALFDWFISGRKRFVAPHKVLQEDVE
ncbi:hypothetical protein B0A48_05647 [Cryoendolithus antarcticus]|uniref:Amino acid transporter n=1 Tax=Cryoendolithus antarcticus TaxID=1507870 RepID=A0A1V8TJG7_9PEZI|nr:hypothetical protein B0A48_05647 [Cryoendolithus antarcticus]